MKAVKRSILAISLMVFVVLSSCDKQEDTSESLIVGTPTCELNLSGDYDEYSYGEVVSVTATTIENVESVSQMLLYLNGQLIFNTTLQSFTLDIKTEGKVAGEYALELIVKNSLDSIGTDTASFAITAIEPVVRTSKVECAGIDAVVYGDIGHTGGILATWGFCYNNTGSPTKEENNYSTTEYSFSLELKDLEPLTNYYFKAWATNELGTVYGEELQFRTTDEIGTFIDRRDDKEYSWVKIGEQIWMSENLAWEGDGDSVYIVNDAETWSNSKNACSYYFGDKNTYKAYGIYYQFRAAQNACPSGWRLPTEDDWLELIQTVGSLEVAGKELKTTTGWKEDGNGTNYSGFNGAPYGFRFNDGSYYWSESTISRYAIWWIDKNNGRYASTLNIKYDSDEVSIADNLLSMSHGRNVRCIKDD